MIISKVLPELKSKKVIYNLEKKDIPNGSIKYELNLIEFPIFSKNNNIEKNTEVKYIFSEKTEEYLVVSPGNNSESICNKILQEFDEKIFYGLMRLYEESGERKIISNYPELLKISGVKYHSSMLYRVKDSLERMSQCTIHFSNSFYNAKAKLEGNEYIKQSKRLHLLSSLETVTLSKLNEKEREDYKTHFNKHKNIKELFIATLNEDIVNNLENKGHKYFKMKELLEIKNSTARKLYILLTKWKVLKNQKNGSLRRTTRFLASRIPLSWKKENISGTIRVLEKACYLLKETGKIDIFKINKEEGLINSTIDFYFKKNENDMLEELNNCVGIEETGQENLEIRKIEKKVIKEENVIAEIVEDGKTYSKEVLEVFSLLPEKVKLESRKIKLEELLKKYNFEEIKNNIEYTKKNSKENFFAYLEKSLKNNYAKEAQEAVEIVKKRKNKNLKKILEEENENLKKEAEERQKVLDKTKLYQDYYKFYTQFDEEKRHEVSLKARDMMVKDGFDEKNHKILKSNFENVYCYKAMIELNIKIEEEEIEYIIF